MTSFAFFPWLLLFGFWIVALQSFTCSAGRKGVCVRVRGWGLAMCRGGDHGAMQRLARRDLAERQRLVAMADPEKVVISTAWDFEAQAARRAARAAAMQRGGVFPSGVVRGGPVGVGGGRPRQGLVPDPNLSDEEGEEEGPLMWFDAKGALVQAPVFVPASGSSSQPEQATPQ